MADDFKTVKPPSALTRSIQRVRTTIKGVSEAWFGPMQPLKPQAQDAKGRIWDYPVAFNLNYQPRANMALSFHDLQALADNCGILRSVIETRKDQLESIDWHIQPRKVNKKTVLPSGDQNDRIKYASQLFMSPSKETDWPQFVRQILEQHFVYDAPSLEMVPNRSGQLCNIKVLDGATISVMLDANGGIPSPPSVAYQQVLKGLPAVDFTSDELLYYPRNRRPGFAYGYPHVAQIYTYVNLSIKRVTEQLAAYDGANAPHGVMEAGTNMTIDQITAMQQYWDGMFTGKIVNRAKTWWVPNGSKYTALGAGEILFDEFDEWLARVICYCFSISPTPFIKQNNRATAESSQDMAQNEGTKPTMVYLKHLFDRILSKHLNSPDLEFVWDHDFETDPAQAAEITTTYVKSGIMTIDEAREDLGMDAFGGAAGEPMALTATGYVPIDPQERTDMGTEASIAARPLLPPGMGAPGQPGQPGGGKALAGPNGGAGKPNAALPPPGKGGGAVPGKPALQAPQGRPAAAPAQARATASVSVKKPGQPVQKVLTTEAVYEVERPLANPGGLQDWARSIGLQPLDRLVVKFTGFVEPEATEPFLLVENYTARLAKDEDGFRLYFDWQPLLDRASELLAVDGTPSILLTDPTDAELPEDAQAYTGELLLGPEEITKRWDLAAFDADHDPTPGQKRAGNYRMGHIQFQGLDLSIENPVGSARRGDDWKVIMPHHYGYIKGTVGADGDHIDAFVGPNPDAKMVYVIDQNDPDRGSFDEHKVMLGFDTWTAAKLAYQQAFTDGKQRIGNAAMLTMDAFKRWLATGDTMLPIGVAMAKDVTMATGLYGYDQGPVLTPHEKQTDEEDENNDVVSAGPQPVLKSDARRFSRWVDY